MLQSRRTVLSLLTVSAISAFFLRFAYPSLDSYFSPDDSMNLYRSWYSPLSSLIKANFLFFLNSPFYRPMVSVWYRFIYYFAGFNPVPFHVAILLILAFNTWLTYALCRRLTGSREVGALAALLFSFHPKLGYLFFDTGYAYDVICFSFYFGAFLFYVRIRQQARAFRVWEWFAFFALYICALNSKEMAITLPLFMAIYELLYGPVPWKSVRQSGRWLTGEGRLLLAMAIVTLVFVAGRGLDPSNSLLAIGPYQPVFTWARFMETSVGFMNGLFLTRYPMGPGAVLAIWMALFAIAWATKSRALRFAWLFLMLSVIPIAFILPRGPAQYYIPFFGWVVYTATLLVRGAEYLWRRLPHSDTRWLQALRAPALFIIAGLLLLHYYRRPWAEYFDKSMEPEQVRSVVEQLHQLRPALRHDSRILFLDDPYSDNYRMMYLVQLSYRDSSLKVDRANSLPHPPNQKEIASYDYVFDYHLGRFYTSAHPRPQGPEPALTFEWGQPDVFHSAGFTRVTRQNPAKRGELVIAEAKDLGDTNPKVPSGQPFPQDPLLHVVTPVSVRVGGQLVDVVLKIGWPEKVNIYRIDFCIPKNVQPGPVEVEITASNVTGPALAIPVR